MDALYKIWPCCSGENHNNVKRLWRQHNTAWGRSRTTETQRVLELQPVENGRWKQCRNYSRRSYSRLTMAPSQRQRGGRWSLDREQDTAEEHGSESAVPDTTVPEPAGLRVSSHKTTAFFPSTPLAIPLFPLSIRFYLILSPFPLSIPFSPLSITLSPLFYPLFPSFFTLSPSFYPPFIARI